MGTIDSGQKVVVIGDVENERHGIRVFASLLFLRESEDQDESMRYRLGYKLLDSNGDRVPVHVQDDQGVDDTYLYAIDNYSYTSYYTISLDVSTLGTKAATVYLVPDEPLDPNEEYTVHVRLQSRPDSKLARIWSPVLTDSVGDPTSYVTFGWPNRKNIVTVTGTPTITRGWAVKGVSGSFSVRIPVTYYRYDPGGSTTTVRPDFSMTLDGPDGTTIPATLVGGTDVGMSVPVSPYSGTQPYKTGTYNSTLIYTVSPDNGTGLLPSTDGQFLLSISTSHNDADTGTATVYAQEQSIESYLLHFSGQLDFGDVSTTITSLTGGPAASSIVLTTSPSRYFDTSLTSLRGTVDSTGHTYGAANFSVRLLPSGDAVVIGSSSYVATAPKTPDEDTSNGYKIRRGGVVLSSSGAVANGLSLKLPRGLGWSDELPSTNHLLNAWIDLQSSNVTLDENLLPLASSYQLVTGGDFFLCEESKPFTFGVSTVTWYRSSEKLSWTANSITPVHGLQWKRLEAAVAEAKSAGIPEAVADAWLVRPSNRQLLRFAHLNSGKRTVQCTLGDHGDAQLSFFFSMTEAYANSTVQTILRPHTPWGVEIPWKGEGTATVVDDEITSGEIFGFGSEGITLTYDLGASGQDCGYSNVRTFRFVPDNDVLYMTRDGGLVGPIKDAGGEPVLAWGLTQDESGAIQPVHAVSGWTDDCGSFMSTGAFLPGAVTWALPKTRDGFGTLSPSALDNSGFELVKHENGTYETRAERPNTDAYQTGLADYPGLNLRVAPATGTITGVSHIGGVRIPMTGDSRYTLKKNSKYYVRAGGVSGSHDVAAATLDASDMLIYGYPFSFGYFGLAYLDSSNEGQDSTTTGGLSFDGMPLVNSGSFELNFDAMSISDGGQLASGELVLDDNPKRALAYWNGSIKLRDFSFEPGENTCANLRYLTLGIEAYGALIDQPMYGRIALHSMTTGEGQRTFGNFLTFEEADAMPAPLKYANGRLRLPTSVHLRGPADTTSPGDYELYRLTTTGDAYFNTYDNAGGASERPERGFICFPATMDVAYFKDIPVHVRTPAANSVGGEEASARVYMSGGWGALWDDPAAFDARHEGFDPSGTVTDYWLNNYEDEDHQIIAEQELFGVFDLSYELEWQPALGYFKSGKHGTDLYILQTEHRLNYLSPVRADISFGASARVDVTPSIDLGNIGINALEETGIFDAVADAAQGGVVKALTRGTDALNELIDAYPQELFDEMYDEYFYDRFVKSSVGMPTLFDEIMTVAQKGYVIRVDGEDAYRQIIHGLSGQRYRCPL